MGLAYSAATTLRRWKAIFKAYSTTTAVAAATASQCTIGNPSVSYTPLSTSRPSAAGTTGSGSFETLSLTYMLPPSSVRPHAVRGPMIKPGAPPINQVIPAGAKRSVEKDRPSERGARRATRRG